MMNGMMADLLRQEAAAAAQMQARNGVDIPRGAIDLGIHPGGPPNMPYWKNAPVGVRPPYRKRQLQVPDNQIDVDTIKRTRVLSGDNNAWYKTEFKNNGVAREINSSLQQQPSFLTSQLPDRFHVPPLYMTLPTPALSSYSAPAYSNSGPSMSTAPPHATGPRLTSNYMSHGGGHHLPMPPPQMMLPNHTTGHPQMPLARQMAMQSHAQSYLQLPRQNLISTGQPSYTHASREHHIPSYMLAQNMNMHHSLQYFNAAHSSLPTGPHMSYMNHHRPTGPPAPPPSLYMRQQQTPAYMYTAQRWPAPLAKAPTPRWLTNTNKAFETIEKNVVKGNFRNIELHTLCENFETNGYDEDGVVFGIDGHGDWEEPSHVPHTWGLLRAGLQTCQQTRGNASASASSSLANNNTDYASSNSMNPRNVHHRYMMNENNMQSASAHSAHTDSSRCSSCHNQHRMPTSLMCTECEVAAEELLKRQRDVEARPVSFVFLGTSTCPSQATSTPFNNNDNSNLPTWHGIPRSHLVQHLASSPAAQLPSQENPWSFPTPNIKPIPPPINADHLARENWAEIEAEQRKAVAKRVAEGTQRRRGGKIKTKASFRKCEKINCSKAAKGRTSCCISHGGGKRCAHTGCTKSARGVTAFCIGHGGGRRCMAEGCTKGAEGSTFHCKMHGGGRRCKTDGCTRSARGGTNHCITHMGGKRCFTPNCKRAAVGATNHCIAHGGGTRCRIETCTKAAQGATPYCKAHGGGRRCKAPNCLRSAEGAASFCVCHGGGTRCSIVDVDGVRCSNKAQGASKRCRAHGGVRRCMFMDEFNKTTCPNAAEGSSRHCKQHFGFRTCAIVGCPEKVPANSDLCDLHSQGECQHAGCAVVVRGDKVYCDTHVETEIEGRDDVVVPSCLAA